MSSSKKKAAADLKTSPWWIVPIVLVLLGVIAYANSFEGPFIFDDVPSTIDNKHIKHLWPLTEAMGAVSQTATAGRPIPSLTLTLNYAFGGFDVWGYHAVNLAIHILCGLTLFGLIRRTLASDAHAAWLAGSVALLWELHPLNTEAVTYIVQRTELLVGLFLLLTLYCIARGWTIPAIVACALGMGSKEVMAGAPLIALLYDYAFVSRSWRRIWETRKLLYAGLALTWIILIAEIAAGSRKTTVGFEFGSLSAWAYFKMQTGIILYYLRLSFWPSPLVIDYADWPIPKAAAWIPTMLVLVVLGLLALWALFRKPAAGFLGACFFIILAPSSSFVPIASEVAAERRMYLPLAAVVALIVIGGYSLVRSALPPKAGLIGVLAIAGVFALATYERNFDYRSDFAIWADGVTKRPNNPRAHHNFGVASKALGREEEAFGHFVKAVQLVPTYADALNNVGMILDGRGKSVEAIPYLQKVLKLRPEHRDARYNLALAQHHLGHLDEAEKGYRELLARAPEYLRARNNLAVLLIGRGDKAGAIAEWNEILRQDPENADARKNLDFVLSTQGK